MTLVPSSGHAQGSKTDSTSGTVRRPATSAEAAIAEAQLAAMAQGYSQAGLIPAGAMPGGIQQAAYLGGPAPAGMPGYGPAAAPAGYGPAPAYGPAPYAAAPMTPDVYGAYGAMPADYSAMMGGGGMGMGGPGMSGGPMPGGPMPGGPAMGGPMPMGGPMSMGGDCPYCGGQGCDACGAGGHGGGLHHGLLGDVLGVVGPYPDGGCAAIRWFDFAVDFMMLTREDAGRNVNFTSLGIGDANIVLSSNMLDFDDEGSFRFTGAFQIGPGSNLEFTYYGLFTHSDTALAVDDQNLLFSVLSGFGTNPIFGFPETDFSNFQAISYSSTFDSFEANFRQRWMAPNCRYQGSWLVGARHFILDEKFRYLTNSPTVDINGDPFNAQLDDLTITTNAMTGIQFGGDVCICLMPGLRLTGEAKAGVYGNRATTSTTILVNTGADPFVEEQSTNDVAFVGDANAQLLYRINYQWTARVGYNALFVEGVALAPENFNTIPPFGPQEPNRLPFLNDNGNVFYHGWNAGLEFMW